MRHREIIPTDDHQTGQTDRRVAAQADLRQGHCPHDPSAAAHQPRPTRSNDTTASAGSSTSIRRSH